MSENLNELRRLKRHELDERYNNVAKHTMPGLSHYAGEQDRRGRNMQWWVMLWLMVLTLIISAASLLVSLLRR